MMPSVYGWSGQPSFYNAFNAVNVHPASGRRHVASSSALTPPAPSVDTGQSAMPPVSQTLSGYLSPLGAGVLFAAGLATAYGVRGFYRALRLPAIPIKMGKPPVHKISEKPGVRTEENAGLYFTGGNIPSALMYAAQFPEVRRNMMGFVWATLLGYTLGSAADGVKEVLVRKEETQIRADLLQKLSGTFERSLQMKRQGDLALKNQVRTQAGQLLASANLASTGVEAQSFLQRQFRYPGEPVHFDLPTATCLPERFGVTPMQWGTLPQAAPVQAPWMGQVQNSPWPMWGLKTAVFTLGAGVGGLLQLLPKVLQPAQAVGKASPSYVKTVLKAYNTSGLETLFILGTKAQLWSILGLVALGKVGKMLVDAYKEIEVTRKNAQTELTYQQYNWLNLDPHYHQLAESEAVESGLQELKNDLPLLANHPERVKDRVAVLLGNVGRQSTPYYMPMTPMVNLTEARG